MESVEGVVVAAEVGVEVVEIDADDGGAVENGGEVADGIVDGIAGGIAGGIVRVMGVPTDVEANVSMMEDVGDCATFARRAGPGT